MDTPFDELLIDERVRHSALARRLVQTLPGVARYTGSAAAIEKRLRTVPLSAGKKKIHLTLDKGELVKPCPATNPPYLCCRYTVINSANQCPMDCTYCVLQQYLQRPVITLFANTDDIFSQITALKKAQPRRFFRFGTGELADSLALDPWTGQAGDFIPFFNGQRNCLLELKTKSDHIENILRHDPRHVVAAWSVNPPQIILSEELRSASLSARLSAARRCQDHGTLLAFHFDPMLTVPGGEKMYRDTVDRIFCETDGRRIAWISLGALRYPPGLKQAVIDRFPGSSIMYAEMIRGLDGKMRYLRTERVRLFKAVYERIRHHSPEVFVYFCMEPPWVWDEVTGSHPDSNSDLDFRFAMSIYQRFGDVSMDKPCRGAYREDPAAGVQAGHSPRNRS